MLGFYYADSYTWDFLCVGSQGTGSDFQNWVGVGWVR